MSTVTQRINEVTQPRGGYLKPSQFNVYYLNCVEHLKESVNISHALMGLAVDYLVRFMNGTDIRDAFAISLQGAEIASKRKLKNALNDANEFIVKIKGLDEESIICAVKLATFDVWYRQGPGFALGMRSYLEIEPDQDTIFNIRVLVTRTLNFISLYSPIVKDGFDFFPPDVNMMEYQTMVYEGVGVCGGYTGTVSSGDGDYLTKDTLWELKSISSEPTSKHTLQLLMYYIMGKHSGQEVFKDIKKIGIFNPKKNKVYIYDMCWFSKDLIEDIEDRLKITISGFKDYLKRTFYYETLLES